MFILAAGLASGTFGQGYPIFNGTSNTCAGAFLDSGGEGAGGYSNNEDYTYTICPDAPGGAISLNFITFNLSTAGAAPIDAMRIYDGNTTAAPLLGTWTGSSLQGQVVSASAANSTGCLTVVFLSNNTGTGVFAATITCYQPCERPTAVAGNGPVSPLKICPGDAVSFNGSGSHAAPGFSIASRSWDFGDGTILANAPANVSHTYALPGAYTAQLYLLDDNGCASTNRVDLQTLVGTAPNFTGTTGASGCSGETLCLNGVVNATTWTETPQPDLGGGVFLPDNVGDCFSTTLTFSQFAPGQTLTSANQLLDICVNMEHSFMGDLIIRIFSPTGQSVTLHQQGGGGTYLGIPVDNDATPNIQGTCWNYCWSPTATNGTWVDNAGVTLPSGTYESLQPLSGLVGSQLNGTWTFEVCDMWGSDNGFICDWGLEFDPSLYPDLIEFTPVYGSGCDSSFWSGPNIISTSGNCDQVCVGGLAPGNHSYVFTVRDDFGCTYDTTVSVTITPDLLVDAGPDASTCGSPVQLSATVANLPPATNCDYVLSLFDSFGDGWNATGYVTVSIDGISTSWTLLNGFTGSTTINIPDGATIVLEYQRGGILWANEQSFSLTGPTGAVVYSATNPANGIVWIGTAECPGMDLVYSWSPSSGLSDPNIADPVATVASTTQYCVTAFTVGHPDCAITDCVTITVDNPVDAGTNGAVALCADAVPIDLFSQLGGTPQAGGAWADPSGNSHSGSFMPVSDPGGIWTYTVTGAGGCGNSTATSTVTVTVQSLADAGTNGAITLCSNGAPVDLFAQLGGTPDAGGTWSGPSVVAAGLFDPTAMSGGTYTYTVAGTAPCPVETATVNVTINTQPDAGTNGSIALCISSPAIALFPELNGSPDAGGTWSGPSPVVGGQFNPATMAVGDYTYTVAGTAPCPSSNAVVTVNVVTDPDPGTPSTLTRCASDASFDLFGELGGTPDPGGSWTGPSAVVGGQFDPSTMLAGVYTYTITVPPPCSSVSSMVTINLVQPADAGDNSALTLCLSSPASDLFNALGGTPDAGGSWSGPSAVTGGSFNPTTMNPGDYTYTVDGIAPCPADAAVVSVSVTAAPDAGTPGSITLCSSDAAINLFAQLGGTPDAGGAWSGPSIVTGGQFDPATMSAGGYTYTISVPPPCVNAASTVTVAVQTPPDAGTDGSLTLCISSPANDLFTALGGTPDAGGTWIGPSPTTGGSFDPDSMNPGDYAYTVIGTMPCPADAAVVSVSVTAAPDAGTPGSITLCSSDAPIGLFAQLGGTPDAGGAWSGPSAVTGGQFDPATMIAGVYTYTISVPPPCVNAASTVTVAVQAPPDAGTDGSLTLCISSPASSLFNALGGTPDAGGSWIGPSTVVGGLFNPATMIPGNYSYTVNGLAPCPTGSAVVSVGVTAAPDAGSSTSVNLCSSGDPVDLLPLLGGADPGGTWTGPGGILSNGQFVPGTSLAGMYEYTVNGTSPCPSSQAMIAIHVVDLANAGQDGSLAVCTSFGDQDLFNNLQGTPQIGGFWIAPGGAAFSGTLTPATDPGGTYLYVIAVPLPCINDTAAVVVAITTGPDAGLDSSITYCTSAGPVGLMTLLGGSPDEAGTWSGPGGACSNGVHPTYDPAGTYTYTVPGSAPCPNASAIVAISLNLPPFAGYDGSISLCPEAGPASLFTSLGGNPDPGGTWSTPGGMPNPGTFHPGSDPQGAYTYTVHGAAPCPDDMSQATVFVYLVAAPDAGNDSISCTLSGVLGASGSWATGHWSGPSGSVITTPDSAITAVFGVAGGAYTFTWSSVSSEGCASADSVRITFTDAIIPTVDVDSTLCHGSCDGHFMATISGGNVGGPGNFTWQLSGGSGIVMPNTTGYCAGEYVLTVLDTNGCAASVNFTIEEPAPLVMDEINTTDALCPNSCDGTIKVGDPEGTQFSISGGVPQASNQFTGLCPGSYSITLWNANGCSASGTAIIGSPPPVAAHFSVHPDTVFINDPMVTFTNASSANAASFLWDFGDGTNSTETSPEHSFPMGAAEDYVVCLTAYSSNGCPDTYCTPLPVIDLPGIFVPNAFTPDGDGRNDVFRVSGSGLSSKGFHLMIFNRWGELIFDTTDLNESWDGTRNGSIVKNDVYVWTVVAYSRFSIEPYEMKGHVTLLR
mgnify:CR=1 FL=1